MKHANRNAAAAFFAVLVFAAPGVSVAGGADVLRQAQDRAQISELMWNYNRALDTLNADAYVEAYTPDGAFGATKGREALHKMVADLKTGQAEREAKGEPKQGAMYHIETNERLEFTDRDHARNHYYWMTVFAGPPNSPARVAAVGHGVDDLVRVNGKWLIKFRNVAPAAPQD